MHSSTHSGQGFLSTYHCLQSLDTRLLAKCARDFEFKYVQMSLLSMFRLNVFFRPQDTLFTPTKTSSHRVRRGCGLMRDLDSGFLVHARECGQFHIALGHDIVRGIVK